MKVFFIIPIKGPINGAKFLSSQILKYLKIVDICLIDTAQASHGEDFGNFSISKLLAGIALVTKVIRLVRFRSVCYLNLTPHGFAFYRDIILLIILKLKNCIITVHIHANGLEKNNIFLLKFVLKGVKIIVLNDYQKNQISFLKSHVFVLGNTLPLLKEIEIQEIWKLRNYNTLLYFSNISRQKGIHEAVTFYKALKIYVPALQLKIAGTFLDEESKVFIENLISQDNSVEYKGFINVEEQKIKILSESSVLLFMSKPYYEGYPLVYIEALMFGLPILTTPQHIANEVTQNDNGYIIKQPDLHTLKTVASLIKDTDKYQEASRRSYELYQNKFKFELYLQKFQEILFKHP